MGVFSLIPSVLKAGEKLFGGRPWIPEQLLSQAGTTGKKLWDTTLAEQRLARFHTDRFIKVKNDIIKRNGITDEDAANKMLEIVEFPWYNKRVMTREEVAQYPKNVVKAAAEHLKLIEDPIWKIAKNADPKIGYIPGHFTHYAAKSLRQRLTQEIKTVQTSMEAWKSDPDKLEMLGKQLDMLKSRMRSASHVDDTLSALRYQVMPKGGKFGPLNEAREAQKKWGYKADYSEVMDDYIRGAMRKVFLDRYLPKAEKLVHGIGDDWLRNYAFDYVQAQRGMLGAKGRLTLNAALSELFVDPQKGARMFSNSVDFLTRMQYLAKIGLSWFRFPFVNLTQPLLTTYPMVGEAAFTKGLYNFFFHPTERKQVEWLAKSLGVVSHSDIRRSVTEHFGGKISHLQTAEKIATFPAMGSEMLNRYITVSAGLAKAKELGLQGPKMRNYVRDLVNSTQFLYQREAMPLMMSSPAARLLFQFRTFTANYVNFLTKIAKNRKNDPAALARAIGSLTALSGTGWIAGWDFWRKNLLQHAGIDIGDVNPIEMATEALGIVPGFDLGSSLEPFNMPWDVYSLLGPTVGPAVQTAFDVARRPEEKGKALSTYAQRFAPPVTSAVRAVKSLVGEEGRTVRTAPTKSHRAGQVIGQRSPAEMLYLRPPLETQRWKHAQLIARAMYSGRNDLIESYLQDAVKAGLRPYDVLKQARQLSKRWKGVQTVE